MSLLRDVVNVHCLQQLWPGTPFSLAAGAHFGDVGSLPRLRDTAAAFPFAGSISRETEQYPRDTQRHGRSHRWPHTGLPPDTSPDSHVPSSSWAGRGRRSLVQHTHNTLQVHKHPCIHGSPEHWHGPSGNPASLPGSQPLLPIPTRPQLPGLSSLKFAGEYTGTPHAYLVWGDTDTHISHQLAPGTQSATHSPAPATSAEPLTCLTHPGPPSS